MRETWVQSLGREDPLEKEMATHSSTLAWKIPWMEELTVHGVPKSLWGPKESDTTEQFYFLSFSWRNGNKTKINKRDLIKLKAFA